ncbi:MAG: DNA-directed RNA polymerase subunit alpha C-terminal domain-containing protein [Terriglobia bacterium]
MNDIPDLPAHLSQRLIGELDLSTRAYNALSKHGVRTISDLVKLSDEEMLRLPWFGTKCLNEVHQLTQSLLLSSARDHATPKEGFDLAELAQSHPKDASTSLPTDYSLSEWAVPTPAKGDLDTPIERLHLSPRAAKVLGYLGIKTIRQLLRCPKNALRKQPNFGRVSLYELERKVFDSLEGSHQHDFSLGTKAFTARLLACLPERQQRVIADRYGLWDGIAETLQDIGDKLGLTRERIRQIEDKSLRRIRGRFGLHIVVAFLRATFSEALSHRLSGCAGILSEDEAMQGMANDCTLEEAALAVAFMRDICPTEDDIFGLCLRKVGDGVYCVEPETAERYEKVLGLIESGLEGRGGPVAEGKLCDEVLERTRASEHLDWRPLIQRVLAVSPSLTRLRNGTVCLSGWTEVRGRDYPSLAVTALVALGRPAHYKEIWEKAMALYPRLGELSIHAIHNRLTSRSDKFVWVGKGTYGLKAWGLKRPPYIKDKLTELLSEAKYPLPYWHLKVKVLEVCNCKEESVRMTLDLNPRIFRKFADDQYGLREHYERRTHRQG